MSEGLEVPTSIPQTSIFPEAGTEKAVTMSISSVIPLPLGPVTVVISPVFTTRFRLSSILRPNWSTNDTFSATKASAPSFLTVVLGLSSVALTISSTLSMFARA